MCGPISHVDGWNQGRRAPADHYAAFGLGEICDLPGRIDHPYVGRTQDRERLSEALAAAATVTV